MIATKKFLFIHAPKCAGMSISDFLINNLKGHVHYYVPDGHYNESTKWYSKLHIHQGKRHEDLGEAKEILKRRHISIDKLEMILAVVRNPYEMEYSRFNYLKLERPWDKGPAMKIALNNEFSEFAKNAPLCGRKPDEFHFERFYELNGVTPKNLRILKFEDLNQLPEIVKPYLKRNASILPSLNVTSTDKYKLHEIYTQEIEEAIYMKYRWIFDQGYYKRLNF